MRRSVASTAPRSSLPRSASLPRVSPIASRALRAAPGWASNTSVRAPHWASTWTMPRPMVPEPATPATRSAREPSNMRSSMRGEPYCSGYNPLRGSRRRLQQMKRLFAAATSALALAACGAAFAQGFPAKPITLICPWPAGGSTDIYFRKLGEAAARHLGQPLVIENRPGGSGMNGPATMAKTARPDGYTISQLTISAFRMPHMQKVDWDPVNDFTYIIGLAGYTFGIVVKADSPLKSFDDLIAYARANPGKLSYATPGTGTSLHLAMEEIAAKAGVQFLHVPFKGYADGAIALMGG